MLCTGARQVGEMALPCSVARKIYGQSMQPVNVPVLAVRRFPGLRLNIMTLRSERQQTENSFVTVQPRTLHLLQSPCECVNLVKRESAPRRRRLGMGRFRNREAAG